MIKPNDLYKVTKLSADEKLLNDLLTKYLSISYKQMNNKFMDDYKILYKQINVVSENVQNGYNQEDIKELTNKINKDFSMFGDYDSSKNNGISTPLLVMPGWIVFQSWNLLGTKNIKDEISHRFYFGISNDKLYELSNILYDKLKLANIPFYFKTDNNERVERTDNLVLYTSTPLLEQNLKIIEEIKHERPDLINHCYNPSIIVGKFYDKIGYAAEDENAKVSYTNLMCNAFLNSIEKSLKYYISTNSNIQIKSLYQQKIQKYLNNGKDVSSERVKNRIFVDILTKNDPAFKSILLKKFREELVNKDIDINNVCFNKKVKQEVEKFYGNSITSSLITLPNGQTMTKEEYLEKNNILYWVPPTSKVTLKGGKIITGDEYVKGVLERANQFNLFQDLILSDGVTIDREANYHNQELIHNVDEFGKLDVEKNHLQRNSSDELNRMLDETVQNANSIRNIQRRNN